MPGFISCVAVGHDPFVDAYAKSHGGVRGPCADCGVPTWRAPEVKHPPDAKPLCQDCIDRRLGADPDRYRYVLTPEAAAVQRDFDRELVRRN